MDELEKHALVLLQQMMQDPRNAAIGATIERQQAALNRTQTEAGPTPRRVRANVTEVKNGWLVEHDGEQYVFQSEQELAAWFTARRVQRTLQGGG